MAVRRTFPARRSGKAVFRSPSRAYWNRRRRLARPLGTGPRVAPTAGTSAVGLSGTATVTKVVALGGTCSFGLTGASAARKVAPVTGAATTGLSSTSEAARTAAQTGAVSLVAATTATPVKRATQDGVAALGLSGGHVVAARGQGGICGLGLAGAGSARKLAAATGRATLALAATADTSDFRCQDLAATVSAVAHGGAFAAIAHGGAFNSAVSHAATVTAVQYGATDIQLCGR